jgi:putative lipoic acid-binding regulatory protein
MNSDSVFQNPAAVEKGLQLPNLISFRFVGNTGPRYHSRLLSAIESVVQGAQIKRQFQRSSSGGRYTSYRFDIFCTEMGEVEGIYRAVATLPDTKFVL